MGGRGGTSGGKKSGGAQSSSAVDTKLENFIRGIPEGGKKDFFYKHGGYASEDTYKYMTAADKQAMAKDGMVMVNESLPKISGASEKQINYAENIRQRKMTNLVQKSESRTQEIMNVAKNQGKDFYAEMQPHGISNRSAAVNYILGNNPDFKALKTMTSARDIIDKYANNQY